MSTLFAFIGSNAYAQNNAVVMPFSVLPVNAAHSSKAGIGFTENTFVTGNTLDISAGYMSYSPLYIPSTYINVDAEYCLNEKISFSLEGVYGMGQAYDTYNSGGFKTGRYKPTQILAGVGAGYHFLDFLSAKINLKYMTDSPAPETSFGAFSTDVAVIGILPVSVKGKVAAELGIYSLGTKVTSASGVKFSIPASVRISGGYIHDINEENSIRMLAQADYYLHNAFGLAVAAEALIADLILVRAGYNTGAEYVLPSYVSVGAGIKIAGIKLNAAYLLGNKAIGNTFGVSVGYSF